MLTSKQHSLLSFISDRIAVTGSSPSYDEMRAEMRLNSKSGVHRMVTALVERGFIVKRAQRARAIEVIRQAPVRTRPAIPVPPVVVVPFPAQSAARGLASIPLCGAIAAGPPIEAIPDDASRVDVPVAMLGSGEHYALMVSGDSMTGDCIMDGDTAVVRRSQDIVEGRILVVRVSGTEVALKRLRLRGSSAVLESSNPSFPPRVVPAAMVRVQGTLVGIIRSV